MSGFWFRIFCGFTVLMFSFVVFGVCVCGLIVVVLLHVGCVYLWFGFCCFVGFNVIALWMLVITVLRVCLQVCLRVVVLLLLFVVLLGCL